MEPAGGGTERAGGSGGQAEVASRAWELGGGLRALGVEGHSRGTSCGDRESRVRCKASWRIAHVGAVAQGYQQGLLFPSPPPAKRHSHSHSFHRVESGRHLPGLEADTVLMHQRKEKKSSH